MMWPIRRDVRQSGLAARNTVVPSVPPLPRQTGGDSPPHSRAGNGHAREFFPHDPPWLHVTERFVVAGVSLFFLLDGLGLIHLPMAEATRKVAENAVQAWEVAGAIIIPLLCLGSERLHASPVVRVCFMTVLVTSVSLVSYVRLESWPKFTEPVPAPERPPAFSAPVATYTAPSQRRVAQSPSAPPYQPVGQWQPAAVQTQPAYTGQDSREATIARLKDRLLQKD